MAHPFPFTISFKSSENTHNITTLIMQQKTIYKGKGAMMAWYQQEEEQLNSKTFKIVKV